MVGLLSWIICIVLVVAVCPGSAAVRDPIPAQRPGGLNASYPDLARHGAGGLAPVGLSREIVLAQAQGRAPATGQTRNRRGKPAHQRRNEPPRGPAAFVQPASHVVSPASKPVGPRMQLPETGVSPAGIAAAVSPRPQDASRRPPQATMEANLQADQGASPSAISAGRESAGYRYLEIEVSHSAHTFKLLGHTVSGAQDVLYHCNVGLGGPGFPTPVGVYFVTYIYDDNPWWIPPPNRSWAAGQTPSQKVYGGIMAPLLKKRPVKTKNKSVDTEDKIEGPMVFDDYGYRFHGTNALRSIGRNESHGCVRMLPDDVKKAAALIKEHVGVIGDKRQSENGDFVILKAPVRLNLIK